MGWVGHTSCLGDLRNEYVLLVRKPEGRRRLGSRRLKLEDNIKMDLEETGGNGVD
jgi:hypothetical protein